MLRSSLFSRRGFTLIELLLAATIFALLVVGFYAAFSAGILAYHRGEEDSQAYRNARLVLNKIALDFQNALYSSNLGLGGKATEVYFYIMPEILEPAKPASPHSVTYRAQKSVDGIKLMREEETWAESRSKKEKRKRDVREMAFPLLEVSFEYFREVPEEKEKEKSVLAALSREERKFEWVDSWKSKEGFPLGMKITLRYPERGFIRYLPSPLRHFKKSEEETLEGTPSETMEPEPEPPPEPEDIYGD